jgi:Outer membrane protein beta-barrel domain
VNWTPALSLAFLGSCMSVPAAQHAPDGSVPPPAAPSHQIALYLGQRSLDTDNWSPVEDQPMFGLEYSQQSSPESLGWEVGIAGSKDDSTLLGVDVTGSTGEIYGGLRKTFGSDVVRPYIGGGLSFIKAKVEASGAASEDDTSPAAYLHGGVQFLVSDGFFLGLDARLLFGSDITIAGVNGDADYGQLALALGWRF